MKVLEFVNINNLSSIYLKKILSMFLMSVLLFNIFIPKSQEIRSSFISALNCVVSTVQTNFYDEYSNVVMSVINNVLINFNIAKLAGTQVIKAESQKHENDKQAPVNNTLADNAIIIQTGTSSQIETLNLNLSYLIYESKNKLYDVCGNIGVNFGNRATNMGILFFVLFAILVVRIKDTIAVILNKKYRKLNRLAY